MADDTPRLILASGSSYKIGQMERLDVPFEAINADIDERAYEADTLVTLAQILAEAKARAVQAHNADAYVLGCDQIIGLDGKQLHKPGGHDQAVAQLEHLQGKTHQLICAVALCLPSQEVLHAQVIYDMHMRELNPAQIAEYVHRDQPYDCAGSYKLEAGGIRLFRAMRGDDYTAIIGLPLTRVLDLLEESHYPL